MGSGASQAAAASSSETQSSDDDQSWVLDAVNEAWCSSEFQSSVTAFFDTHCEAFSDLQPLESLVEYTLEHDNVFRSYQSLIEDRIKTVVEMYGCDVTATLRSLERKTLGSKDSDDGLKAFVRRLSSYESFPEFAKQMTSHCSSLQHIKMMDAGGSHRDEGKQSGASGASGASDKAVRDHTMEYLVQRTGGSSTAGAVGKNHGKNHQESDESKCSRLEFPSKINAPMMVHHPDVVVKRKLGSSSTSKDIELHELLAEQESLVQEMKHRQKSCVKLATPMNVGKSQLKNLFEYVRDAIIAHDDTTKQHMEVIRDILGLASTGGSAHHNPSSPLSPSTHDDNMNALATEMCALARAQQREERIQQRVDSILPPKSPTGDHQEDELALALEASRQLYDAARSDQHGNSESVGSPTTTLMKRAAISSAAEEAERRARMDANEKHYNKTLEEVMLRSKIEAETEGSERLRKLMLETAMAAQLSEKDHVNSALHDQLIALEAKLAQLQAHTTAASAEKNQTEESLRAELQRKEAARNEIQMEMERIISDSEQKNEQKMQKLMKVANDEGKAREAKENELRLENSVFKKALEREAKEAESARKELDDHRKIASDLRTQLAEAEHSRRQLGHDLESKTMENNQRLENLLNDERVRIQQLETDMELKAEEIMRRATMSAEQAEKERLQQSALHQQHMDELEGLRAADATRLTEYQDRAEVSKEIQIFCFG